MIDLVTSIDRLLDEVKKVYIEELLDKKLVASGGAQQMRKEVGASGGSLYGQSYLFQLKHGRKPGRFPPIDSILDWIRIKGIIANDGVTNDRSLAFLFARKIAREGTDIYSGKKKGIAPDDKVRDVTEAFSRDLGIKIFSEIGLRLKQ